MSLYTKYRPKRFADLVGQEFVRTSLSNALRLGRTVGAYLFTGSRGVGKTTAARIFAKAINCQDRGPDWEPCGTCRNCLAIDRGEFVDIVEIDAASHTGVDNIRDLIEKSRFLPTMGTKKVYIIDEVHMLSKGAFNALLKTLEEPPEHVVFIMATTEIERIPETIVSRAQRFDFGRYAQSEIEWLLRYVCTEEGTIADDRAIALIAKAASGGMRDALTLLEQYSTDSTLPTERVESFLSIVSIERLDMLIDALGSHDTTEIAGFVDFVSERSFSVKRVLEQLLERIAQRMRGANREAIVRLSRCFARVYRAYERCRSLVDPLAILSSGLYSCLDETITTAPERAISTTPVTPPTKHSKNSPRPGMDQLSESGHLIIEKSWPTPNPDPVEIPTKTIPEITSASVGDFGSFDFRTLVDTIRSVPKRAFIAMSLKASQYDLSGETLTIVTPNTFHRSKLESEESLGCIRTVCQERFGFSPQVRITIDTNPVPNLAEAAEELF